MHLNKRCIIVGSGSSIRENLWNVSINQLPIWNAIKNECIFTLNWGYKFIEPTIALFGDYQFYVTEKEKLNKLPILVTIDDAYYKRCKDPYRDEIRCELGKNLYRLKGSNYYYGKDSWKQGFYSKELCGIFAINFALRCGFDKIYCLGFDCCAINGHTHFYDDNPNIGNYTWQGQKHSGVGVNNFGNVYNDPKKLNDFWFKPLENEKNKIINVSPLSVLTIFPKINYEEFYNYLKVMRLNVEQEKIRQEIKELIKDKS